MSAGAATFVGSSLTRFAHLSQAGVYVPISIGFASGDVSLAAFIQSSLARIESEDEEISALGAVMSFLFSTVSLS